jgi:ABC-type uncharacterized transport system permease subunit
VVSPLLAPLIVAGLGVGLAFRAALFNIGGRGQMLMAGAAAGWVGYQFEMPWPIHVTLAILVGMAAGALWGGLVGLLKARTGAHEVIVSTHPPGRSHWLERDVVRRARERFEIPITHVVVDLDRERSLSDDLSDDLSEGLSPPPATAT